MIDDILCSIEHKHMYLIDINNLCIMDFQTSSTSDINDTIFVVNENAAAHTNNRV